MWTYIGIDIDFNIHLTRKVLSEKYNPDLEKIDFFISKLNGCQLFIHDNYKESIFYIKIINGKKEILMEQDESKKLFYIKYSGFWKVFEEKFGMKYVDIQSFTRIQLEGFLNSKEYKTLYVTFGAPLLLESLKEYKIVGTSKGSVYLLEDFLNCKKYETHTDKYSNLHHLNDTLN